MIKTFRKYNNNINSYHVTKINLETGEFTSFHYNVTPNNELVKFSEYTTNYNKPKDYLKRAKRLGYQQVENNFLDNHKKYDPSIYTIEERMEIVKSFDVYK